MYSTTAKFVQPCLFQVKLFSNFEYSPNFDLFFKFIVEGGSTKERNCRHVFVSRSSITIDVGSVVRHVVFNVFSSFMGGRNNNFNFYFNF